jgi:uncharacterized protein
VRGEQESESDLDILVEFEEDPSFFEYIRLEDYLSESGCEGRFSDEICS